MGKSLHLIFMLLMGALAVREGYDIMNHGANTMNVVFCMLFTVLAVRRFLLFSKT